MKTSLKIFSLACMLSLSACNSMDDFTSNFSDFNLFNTKKPVVNQAAVLSKDMYLCETYHADNDKAENYLTYPGYYFRYSKTRLPAVDDYMLHRAQWQQWLTLPNSKSRIVAFLPKGTLFEIHNYKQPNHYDELFGARTQGEITILSGAYKGKRVVIDTTFLHASQ